MRSWFVLSSRSRFRLSCSLVYTETLDPIDSHSDSPNTLRGTSSWKLSKVASYSASCTSMKSFMVSYSVKLLALLSELKKWLFEVPGLGTSYFEETSFKGSLAT